MDYHNPQWQSSMRIRLDINNTLRSVVGAHGIDPVDIQAMAAAAGNALADIEANRAHLGWPDLPAQDISAILAAAQKVMHVENFVVLGIGGSALGNMPCNPHSITPSTTTSRAAHGHTRACMSSTTRTPI